MKPKKAKEKVRIISGVPFVQRKMGTIEKTRGDYFRGALYGVKLHSRKNLVWVDKTQVRFLKSKEEVS